MNETKNVTVSGYRVEASSRNVIRLDMTVVNEDALQWNKMVDENESMRVMKTG
jgi:hypothetical protein